MNHYLAEYFEGNWFLKLKLASAFTFHMLSIDISFIQINLRFAQLFFLSFNTPIIDDADLSTAWGAFLHVID